MERSLTVLTRIFPVGLLLSGSALSAFAQLLPPPVAPPPDRTTAQQTAPALSPQQLQNLVAPLALYPDPLLSQVLAASTYPLEVIEAQQWLRQAGNLHGQELMDAAKQQNWDPSVQALVAFPDVLAMLTRDIRWTRALGDAFLNQQADVMNAIQTMRASARSNGRLQSTPQQEVNIEHTLDPQTGVQDPITIQPTDPQVIYPPTYDPAYVWGPPPVGAYPDLYYPDYGFGYYPPVYLNSYFGGYGGFGWGWGFNWYGRGLYVNSVFFNHYGFHNGYHGYGYGGGHNQWTHDPGHRQGIPYPNRSVAGRYGSGSSSFSGRSYNGSGFVQGNIQGSNNQRSSIQGSNSGYRSFSSTPAQSTAQGFRSFSNSAPQSRPQQSYRGNASSTPQRSYQSFRSAAPQQSFRSAPQQSFRTAPQQSFRGGGSPRMSSPAGGGGGGGVRSGGGGGGARSSGGGGGGHHR